MLLKQQWLFPCCSTLSGAAATTLRWGWWMPWSPWISWWMSLTLTWTSPTPSMHSRRPRASARPTQIKVPYREREGPGVDKQPGWHVYLSPCCRLVPPGGSDPWCWEDAGSLGRTTGTVQYSKTQVEQREIEVSMNCLCAVGCSRRHLPCGLQVSGVNSVQRQHLHGKPRRQKPNIQVSFRGLFHLSKWMKLWFSKCEFNTDTMH